MGIKNVSVCGGHSRCSCVAVKGDKTLTSCSAPSLACNPRRLCLRHSTATQSRAARQNFQSTCGRRRHTDTLQRPTSHPPTHACCCCYINTYVDTPSMKDIYKDE